jgi:chromosome segregation ATPase
MSLEELWENVMGIKLFTVLCVMLQFTDGLVAKTLQQMQNLYENIGDDLMCIRREFTATQPRVYSVLDRIDKIYNLAKIAVDKKNRCKDILRNQGAETQKLQEEIGVLKSKLAATESDLETATNQLEEANRVVLEEKSQSLKLAQEKLKISKEQRDLKMQMKNIRSEKSKKQEHRDLLNEIKNLNGLSDEEQVLLNQAQSLSLSSTSAPSSPR